MSVRNSIQDSPEALHRAIVNTAANTGHTLRHSGIQQLLVESSAGVLESTVTVEQWVSIWIFQNSFIKRIKNQLVVIPVTNNIADNSPVTQIEDRAQIELVRVPSPSAYKVQKGLPVSTRGYDDPMWGVRMIHSILTNPTYTGDLAQGRSRVKSYKVHQIEAVPREEWVEVAGTHEAIIDYETFDKVQALLQRDTRTSPKGREVHLFSGFLKCADCGRAITRCVGKNNNVYYSCSTYKNRSRTACTMHSIKHERLEAAVLFAVQHQVHLAVSYSEIVTQINSAPIKKSQSYRLDDLIAAKERELTKITRYKQSLYQDWKDGEITQQEYRDMKADYERQTSDISAVLTRLNAERAELANGVDNEHPALVAFMKYQNIEALNREILVELVDYIKVYENGNISVKFKFADELRKIAEYIEINTTEDTAVAG